MTNISVKRATDGFSVALPASPSLWRLAKAEDLYKLDTLLEGGLYLSLIHILSSAIAEATQRYAGTERTLLPTPPELLPPLA